MRSKLILPSAGSQRHITSQSQYYTNLRSSSSTPQDPYIHTQGGRFYIDRPTWRPNWMAHSMGQTARYRGHAEEFYSVAEHEVLVAALMRDVVGGDPYEGILHDGVESVLPDVSSPFKQLLPDLRQLEKVLDKDLRSYFYLPLEKTQEATYADWLALFIEAAELIPERGEDFVDPYKIRGEALALRAEGWRLLRLDWKEAKKLWLGAFDQLRSAKGWKRGDKWWR